MAILIPPEIKNPCGACFKRPASHAIALGRETIWTCCECYVKQGHPPADWHPDCMKTWEGMQNQSKVAVCRKLEFGTVSSEDAS